ncbi:16S rRNA (uracil(1498)-N(3))-methyltransferase [Acidithiobacillus sp. AMEEHan]|uniref:16S rRNA (uracil(1498)-N(3))-methyltransferase n=1 Tax=Acidithiobacillus sp. AMEEHan TaxID=2994951 RepID=UPI0027E475BE|nr:16S rRNA (uracil(1498)-N(3))-methyltransferase [Acidithiobacillus sp. AMEEHan]
MPRIHLYSDITPRAGEFALAEAPSHHLLRVLRARRGQELTLFTGDGHEYRATLTGVAGKAALLAVEEGILRDTASPLAVTLAVPVLRGERWDWLLQKATELGVARIQPLHSRYCQVPLVETQGEKRRKRWQEILIAAAEQSQATRLPALAPALSLADYLQQSHAPTCLVLDSTAQEGLNSMSGPHATEVELLTGPEGGLAPEELQAARDRGFLLRRCGPRILRAETAPIAALAILQARWGDLG